MPGESENFRLDPDFLTRFLYPAVIVDQQTLAILEANDAMAQRYGYAKDELLSMSISDLRVAQERHLVAPATAEMATEPSIHGPFRHVTAAGRTLFTEVVSIPGEFEGRPAIAAFLIDATERIVAEDRARVLFDKMPIAAWIHDCDTLEILAVNDAAVAMYGYSREELLSMKLFELRPDNDREAVLELFRRNRTGEIRRIYNHVRKDGTRMAVEAASAPIPYGTRNARLGAGRDVTRELMWEQTLQRAKDSLDEAQELTHLGSWQYDFVSSRTMRSKELCRILGLPENADTGAGSVYDHVHPEDVDVLRSAIESTNKDGLFTVEHRIVRGDGQTRWVSTRGRVQSDISGAPVSITGTVLDITEQRRREEHLQFLAYHDPLTGLPNRQSMKGRIDRTLSGERAAVLFIDFESFKEINDTFGHEQGDVLLVQVAERLRRAARNSDVCRWGGDEFVIAAPVDDGFTHEDLLRSVRNALEPPYELEGRRLFLTPSIGIALYPEHGRHADELVRNADTAMYQAKQLKIACELFHPSMLEAARTRLYVQHGLHEALRSNQFALALQPIVAAETGDVVSAEALLRWHHPTRGVQMPGSFIDLAEQTGLILQIGNWVVHEACRIIRELHAHGIFLPLSVNVASQQFDGSHIIDSIREATDFYETPPQALHIEITESGIMRDVTHSIEVMRELRAIGLRIALDDFGAGYSSLSHLKSLPVDIMKVDRSLVSGVADVEQDRKIFTSVLQLAQATGLFVVAEGVETAAQSSVLTAMQCNALQGYYFSKPLDTGTFVEFVRPKLSTSR